MFELTLTSRALQARVDEFVLEGTTFKLVDKMRILCRYHIYDEEKNESTFNQRGTMRVWLEVPVRMASLFELRVKCRVANWRSIMSTGWGTKDRGPIGFVKRYCFHCEIPVQSGADTTDWERMMKSIGPNVRKVDVVDGYNSEFLLELSTHLRSMYFRCRNYADISGVNWVLLIIGMLSRKLDMLEIHHWQREVISREDAERLVTKLPFLGKKVWFKIGVAFRTVGRSNELNSHITLETSGRPNTPDEDCALSIIHKSRQWACLQGGNEGIGIFETQKAKGRNLLIIYT
ncbi:hypothetical protein PRIPAC_78766 [Pristionchus pacificus]|uniref:Uncharacterized protein n=1 Tax=Pristionchus pacificus TaxID=54126 RepID=A0A2A6CL88_PRIPA|nr:hypothetical protein PRIPAC_78766 [Pristionchus pacificus]|eukprot:PDM78813.1 hypothetical protein PRIPAC_31392 [Pristionchus pacificus]